MTRGTSSRYVNTTTSGAAGPQATDPLYATTFADMEQQRGAEKVSMLDAKYAVWFAKGWLVHLLGLHTWVPLEEWDVENGSMRIVGTSCWHCDAVVR